MNVRLPFHRQLRYEREKRNWAQHYVAEQIGVDVKTVVRWETAKGLPRPDARRRLCEIFAMDAEALGLLTKSTSTISSSSLSPPSLQKQVQEYAEPALHLDSNLLSTFPSEAGQNQDNSGIVSRPKWVDWQEAPDTVDFYGRTREFNTLKRWILDDACRMVAIVGAGGVGKSTLVTRLAMQLQDAFTCIFWRSLHNAPPLEQILKQCIPFISRQQCTSLPESIDEQIEVFLAYCKKYRCLIVLDNVESIMQAGELVGKYRKGYETYGKLLLRMGQTQQQSCLLLTSREKPKEIARLEGNAASVRALNLIGIEPTEGQEILRNRGLSVSDADAARLVEHYAGNPLALKLIAETIQSIFQGNVAAFLQEGETVFGSIHELLAQQFYHLSEQEREILYWLAVERESASLENIRSNLVDPSTKALLVQTVDSLCRRSMIEVKASALFTLQPVIMEYVTAELIKYFCRSFDQNMHIHVGMGKAWLNYALIKATARDYVRESQLRLILMPVAQQLLTEAGRKGVEQRLRQALTLQQREYALQSSYLAGNALNLLTYLQSDLRGQDFSSLVIWQAYLQGVSLADVNVAHAHFIDAVFTNASGNILTVTFNAVGDIFAVGTANGDVLIFQTANTALLFTFREHTDAVWSVAFSPDGSILASCSDDHQVRLWSMQTGECLSVLQKHTNRVRSIAFTPDGKFLASGGEDQNIFLWDISRGQCITALQGHAERVWSVTFSPDGRLLASGSTDHSIRLWQVETGKCLRILEGHTGWVRAVTFQHNGSILASAGDDCTLRLWDVESGEQIKILQGHTKHIWCIAASPDGKLLASAGEDRTIRLWNMETDQSILTLQGHAHSIRSIAFSPDSQTLISGGEDQTTRLWHVESGQGLTTLHGYTNRVWSAIFSADGQTLASCNEDRVIRLWDRDSGNCFMKLSDSTHGARAIAFSPDGKALVSGGEDQTVRLWNVQTGQCSKTLRGHSGWIRSIAFSSANGMVASGAEDRTIRLWNVNTGQYLKTLTGHTSWIRSVAFSADGTLLASSGDDSAIRLWDVATGCILRILNDHRGQVRSVAFNPKQHLLASASEDQTVRLWDVSTGKCLKILRGHTNWVRWVAFSPDGYTLVSSSDDHTVCLWTVGNDEQELTFLHGHRDRVRCASFSPDGSFIASSSDDGSVQLWDRRQTEVQGVKALFNERPYERMNITGVRGLTEAQKSTLQTLGAYEEQ